MNCAPLGRGNRCMEERWRVALGDPVCGVLSAESNRHPSHNWTAVGARYIAPAAYNHLFIISIYIDLLAAYNHSVIIVAVWPPWRDIADAGAMYRAPTTDFPDFTPAILHRDHATAGDNE